MTGSSGRWHPQRRSSRPCSRHWQAIRSTAQRSPGTRTCPKRCTHSCCSRQILRSAWRWPATHRPAPTFWRPPLDRREEVRRRVASNPALPMPARTAIGARPRRVRAAGAGRKPFAGPAVAGGPDHRRRKHPAGAGAQPGAGPRRGRCAADRVGGRAVPDGGAPSAEHGAAAAVGKRPGACGPGIPGGEPIPVPGSAGAAQHRSIPGNPHRSGPQPRAGQPGAGADRRRRRLLPALHAGGQPRAGPAGAADSPRCPGRGAVAVASRRHPPRTGARAGHALDAGEPGPSGARSARRTAHREARVLAAAAVHPDPLVRWALVGNDRIGADRLGRLITDAEPAIAAGARVRFLTGLAG